MGRVGLGLAPRWYLAFVLAFLAGLDALPGTTRAWPLRHPRALQQIKGCTFSSANGNLLSDAFVKAQGWTLATPKGALECLNQVQVDYNFAYESVVNLAKIFNQSYVFVAMAADPTYQQPLPSIIYNDAVDVPGELKALADSWPVNESVPLGDLQFTVNEVFNRLRDAHVDVAGVGDSGESGTMLGNAVVKATQVPENTGDGDGRAYLVDLSYGELLIGLEVHKEACGNLKLRGKFYLASKATVYRTFTSIDGKRPMKYFLELANNPVLRLRYKPAGTRFNQLLTKFESFHMNELGRITNLPQPVKVQYADSSSSVLAWGITFAPTITTSRMARIQKQANTPGVPFMALRKAIDTYKHGNMTITAAPAVTHTPAVSTTARPEAKESRLHVGASLPTNLTYLKDSNNDAYGFYYMNQTNNVAVLKLSTFRFEEELMQDWWPKFVAAAKRAGAKDLLLDLTDNTGGLMDPGISLALALYPEAKYKDFGLRYDHIIGEDAVYAYRAGLKPQTLNTTIQSVIKNNTLMQARVALLKRNRTELLRLTRKTKIVTEALTVLFDSASKDQTQLCNDVLTGEVISCRSQWRRVASQLNVQVENITQQGLTVLSLSRFLGSSLTSTLKFLWPYTGVTGDNNSDPYATPQMSMRGGKSRFYTAKFDVLGIPGNFTVFDFFGELPRDYTAPFRKILAVSDGSCGSICDTFSRMAWFYSRKNPTAPAFKYFTFGGTGHAVDSSGTAFPGGNVNTRDFLTASWAYHVIGELTADWMSWGLLKTRIDAWSKLLPIFPAFLDKYTPGYTQSEIFNVEALGADSPPMEYIQIPTDYYAPVWYMATDMPEEDVPSDLPALYATALSVIESMPGPSPGLSALG